MINQSNYIQKKEDQSNEWEILQSEIQGNSQPATLKPRNNIGSNYYEESVLEKIEEKESIEEDSRILSSRNKNYPIQKLNNIRNSLLKILKYKNELYFYWKKLKKVEKNAKTKKKPKKIKKNTKNKNKKNKKKSISKNKR